MLSILTIAQPYLRQLRYRWQRATPSARYAVTAAPIDPSMLRRLVQLCHPDRHGNSEAANIATRYLLQLKNSH